MSRPAARLPALRRFAIGVLLLSVAVSSPAEPTAGTLFVVSDPLGAHVLLDGTRLEGNTPLVLRRVQAGPHTILVRRDGFAPREQLCEVRPGETVVVDAVLEPRSFVAGIYGERGWTLNGVSSGRDLLRLPQGDYLVDREPGGSLRVRPRYGGQRLIDGLAITIPFSLGFTVALSAHEATAAVGKGPALSPFTIAAWITDALLFAADIALHLDRRRFLASFRAQPLAEDPSLATLLFDEAEQELSAGRFDSAIELYTRIVELHPESPTAGRALYMRAMIELILGRQGEAAADLERFVTVLPLPSLYDRATQQLAGLLLEAGDPAGCLARLDAMLGLDRSIVIEEVDWLRARALLAAARAGIAAAAPAVEWLQGVVERYPGSVLLEEYRAALDEALGLPTDAAR